MRVSYSTKNIIHNSARSVIYKVASMALSLVSAPLLLWSLGEEKYGVWQTLLSTVSWIYYLDLGIGGGLRIRLSESLAENKIDSAKKQISISYVILTIICTLVFAIVGILLLFFDLKTILNVDVKINENVNTIFVVAFLFVVLNLEFSLINNFFYAVQNASMVGALNLAGQALFVVGLYLYYKTGEGLILVVSIIEGSSQLLKNIIGTIIAFHIYPECKPSIKCVDFKYAKEIVSFGIYAFIGNILALILNSTDNIIILQYFGALKVTPYSFCFKFFGMISGIFAMIVVPLQSAYTMAYKKKDYLWIKKSLKRASVIFVVFVMGTIVLALLIRPITHIWLRKDLAFTDGTIFWTTIYTCFLMMGHVQSTFLIGLGRVKETAIASIFEAMLNIPLSMFLANNAGMGVDGVILGSVISLSIGIIVALLVMKDSISKFY